MVQTNYGHTLHTASHNEKTSCAKPCHKRKAKISSLLFPSSWPVSFTGHFSWMVRHHPRRGASIKKFAEDVDLAEKDLQNSGGFYRRSYIRALFSMIEGTIFILKQTCLTDLFSSGKLSPNDLAMLREINYDIDNKGDTYEQIKFIKIDTNFKYCVKTLDKVFQTGYIIDTSNIDWQNFLKAIAVRNRITHPKSIDDLNITDDEIQFIQKTSQWFNYFIIHCVTKVFEKLGMTQIQNGT